MKEGGLWENVSILRATRRKSWRNKNREARANNPRLPEAFDPGRGQGKTRIVHLPNAYIPAS
jgi:hypothetical protein